MRIGICDDNPADARMIAFALADVSPGVAFERYDSGAALLEAAKKEPPFNLVFLDIYLKKENGLEIAERLRKISPETEIIFSTTSRDFAVEAFKVQAADYLVKPHTEEDVLQAFARAKVRKRNKPPEGILLQAGKDTFFFRPEDVLKIESDRHYTCITATAGEVTRLRMGYSEVAPRFTDTFIELRRGITVNMMYITGIRGDTVTLSDGSRYTVTKAKLDKVIGNFARYISEN